MPPKCKYADTQNTDIAILKENTKEIKDFIFDLKTNHLDHIYKRLNQIERNQAYWGGGLAVLIAISQLIIYVLK